MISKKELLKEFHKQIGIVSYANAGSDFYQMCPDQRAKELADKKEAQQKMRDMWPQVKQWKDEIEWGLTHMKLD